MDEQAIKEMRDWFNEVTKRLGAEGKAGYGDMEEMMLVTGKMFMLDDVEAKFRQVLNKSRQRTREAPK